MNELATNFNPETPELYVPREIEKKIARLLIEKGGNITAVAKSYGCSRWNIYLHLKKSEFLRFVFEDERGRRVDRAEAQLDLAVERGEPWAIALVLRTLGKERGYVEKVEQSGSVEHRHTIEDWKKEAVKKLKELEEQAASRKN